EALARREAALAAGEARVVGWDVTVPVGATSLGWEIDAVEGGGAADRVAVAQTVLPAVPVRVYQATLAQVVAPIRQPIERPAEALAGRGGVSVTLAPSLVDGLGPMRDWMRRYPYTRLRQEVPRAAARRDEPLWRQVTGGLSGYLDADGLLKYFPSMRQGSEVLTAYVLAVAQEAGWTLPPAVESRATA